MIGIEGQYIASFSIANKQDFIQEGEIHLFTLIEEAGNSLPTFQLTFDTDDDTLLPLLHEGNDLKVIIGKDKNNLFETKLSIAKVESNKIGFHKRLISLAGFYSALPYIGNSKINITEKKSGIEIMRNVANLNFTVDTNIDKSSDNQRWIQYNITDRKFIQELWLHSYIPNSFVAIGISSDGKFIIRDVNKLLSNGYKWNFTSIVKDKNKDIIYDGDATFTLNTGLINNWVGYGREKLIYNLEDAENTYSLEEVDPSLAIAKSIIKNSNVTKKSSSIAMINENTDPNYWEAYQRNLAHLATYSSLKLTLSCTETFFPIRILDVAMFTEENTQNEKESAEYHSGLYLITKVSRSIGNRQFSTIVQMCREAPNRIKNDTNNL